MVDFVKNLPRDVQLHIIKFLDLESRRALNIYSKLKIPEDIIIKLQSIPKIIKEPSLIMDDDYITNIFLGNRKIKLNDNIFNLSIYNMQILDCLPTKIVMHVNNETCTIERYIKDSSLDHYEMNNIAGPRFLPIF